jgi:hypothetical protein
MKEQLLVDKDYLLKKFPGKGGWTYAEIPEVTGDAHSKFGWVMVKGSIDGHHFSRYHLASMGNGSLFFPVKASTRKKIMKQAGDVVRIVLYKDDSKVEVPAELLECLQTEPVALERFLSLEDQEKEMHIKRIYSAKKAETRADRIVQLIKQLLPCLFTFVLVI